MPVSGLHLAAHGRARAVLTVPSLQAKGMACRNSPGNVLALPGERQVRVCLMRRGVRSLQRVWKGGGMSQTVTHSGLTGNDSLVCQRDTSPRAHDRSFLARGKLGAKSTMKRIPRFQLNQIVLCRDLEGRVVKAKVCERAVCKSFALARILNSNELVILSPSNLAVGEAERAA